jgi:hypothetical protein
VKRFQSPDERAAIRTFDVSAVLEENGRNKIPVVQESMTGCEVREECPGGGILITTQTALLQVHFLHDEHDDDRIRQERGLSDCV